MGAAACANVGWKDGEAVGTAVGAFVRAAMGFLVGEDKVIGDGALEGVAVGAARVEQTASLVAAGSKSNGI